MNESVKQLMESGMTELEALRTLNNAQRVAAGLNEMDYSQSLPITKTALPKARDEFQIHRDTVLQTCKIEVGIDNAIDSINHVVDQIDEGMDVNTQVGILKGAVSLLHSQIRELCKMRIPHFNAVPDQPCDNEPCVTCMHDSACNGHEVTA